MKAITYRIFLEQPLLATQILGDPNSSVSFTYIAGSQMRGMLIHRYREAHNLAEAQVAHNPDCRRLFFNGSTRFLHAYPLADGALRTLPTPRALLKRKNDESSTVYNAAHEEFDRQDAEAGDTLKPAGKPFCIVNDDTLMLHEPQPNHVAVHVMRERAKGRAIDGQGAVFQYDALAAGQWFGGVILLDQDTDTVTLRGLLPGIAWLGRSRSAGYGKVQIELGPEHNDTWREIGGTPPACAAGTSLTMTLLSDTILRGTEGQPALMLDAATLSAYLGVPVTTVDGAHSFSAVAPQGGFNRTWCLPLAQSYALAAGSTVVFTPTQALDARMVRRLEQQGIGERRNEGFGRVAFNWVDTVELTRSEGVPYSTSTARQPLSDAGRTIARDMARRLLERRLDEEIARFVRDQVSDKGDVTKSMPANSQLGRVRVLLRRAVREQRPLVAVYTDLVDFKDAGKSQFEQARIMNTSLWDWLSGLLIEPPTRDVWSMIQLSEAQWPKVAGERVLHDTTLTRSVTLRLIDETLAAAARARKREER